MVKAKKPGSTQKPSGGKKKDWKDEHAHLFQKKPRNYGIGRAVQPKRNLSRFVKWPRYIRIQRQRAVLKQRLKVPAPINQFNKTLDKNHATTLFKLLAHYRPESSIEKKKRLSEIAKDEVKDEKKADKADKEKDKEAIAKKGAKQIYVKYGLNHITSLVEKKKARMVVIAHDVDPIELVVWLPALCKKMDVPYCIVKGKARLGQLVHKKSTAAVAVTEVRKDDVNKLDLIISAIKPMFNESIPKKGGGIMGMKAQAVTRKRQKIAAREEANKATKA